MWCCRSAVEFFVGSATCPPAEPWRASTSSSTPSALGRLRAGIVQNNICEASAPEIGQAHLTAMSSLGIHIDADNAFVQAATYALVLAGLAAVAAPIISTFRVLLSLFVLPGKPVRLNVDNSAFDFLNLTPASSPHTGHAAHGHSSPAPPTALVRSLRSRSQPRATTSSSCLARNRNSTPLPQISRPNMAPRSPPKHWPWTLR